MIAIIAEKPNVAQEIGKVLGATGRADGYIYNDTYCVTWAQGHLVELFVPENKREWRTEDLPVLPKQFHLRVRQKNGKPDKDAEKQLQVIRMLFDNCEYIINAGDAGREGELIQRNIYYYLGCTKPVKRLWISSLTKSSIQKGMNELMDSSYFDNLFYSAKARAEADWIVGVNATRALTLSADVGKTLSIGRVQTPTLSIICRRYIENREFVPKKYAVLKAECTWDGLPFTLKTDPYDDLAQAAEDFKAMKEAGEVKIASCETVTDKTAPPLLHDLTSLQQEAYRRYKLSAKKTLEIAQFLYENKYMTYPRTGCRYVPEDIFENIKSLIKPYGNDPDFGQAATRLLENKLNRRSVSDTKITDHHALLITENIPEELNDNQWAVYLLVLERMLEAFAPSCMKERRKIEATCGEVILKASGSVVTDPGWRAVRGTQEDDEEKMPDIGEDEVITPDEFKCEEKETKPKPLLTEDTLLEEMKNPARDCEDERLRKRLAEVGLGTPATRASIIETLYEREYVEKDKGKLIPTSLGISVFCAVDDQQISDPLWTGKWENGLEYIAEGRLNANRFDTEIREYTRKIVEEFLSGEHRRLIRYALASETIKCPSCGKTVRLGPDKAYCSSCGLTVWRTVAGKKLTDVQLRLLLEGGETEVIEGFTNRDGQTFSAALKRTHDNKIKFVNKEEE